MDNESLFKLIVYGLINQYGENNMASIPGKDVKMPEGGRLSFVWYVEDDKAHLIALTGDECDETDLRKILVNKGIVSEDEELEPVSLDEGPEDPVKSLE